MNYLASPLLVVAYALAGRIDINFQNEPLGFDPNLEPIYLRDIWPTMDEINTVMNKVLNSKDYKSIYKSIFKATTRAKRMNNHAEEGAVVLAPRTRLVGRQMRHNQAPRRIAQPKLSRHLHLPADRQRESYPDSPVLALIGFSP